MKSTREIKLDTMITHSISVKKALTKSILVFDMPFNTYKNIKNAKKNVREVFRKSHCDAVKLESNGKNFDIVKKIVESGMPVMGHIGYTPQYKKKFPFNLSSFLSYPLDYFCVYAYFREMREKREERREKREEREREKAGFLFPLSLHKRISRYQSI